jgi:hypothetical protein
MTIGPWQECHPGPRDEAPRPCGMARGPCGMAGTGGTSRAGGQNGQTAGETSGPKDQGAAAGRLLAWAKATDWSFLLLVGLFGLIVISPLMQPGYFWGAHDARHDVYFIFEYDKSVQDGIWFPRWSPDWTFGYGYPFFIVYGPLATFVGELLHHFLGLGYEASVKAVLGLSIILSGLAMYGFVRSWLGRNAALVAAAAYMAIPYHLVDVFVRAAMAESLALVFLPLALWGFRETVARPRAAAILGAAAAYAAIMWTSNLVALVFTPALALYVLVLILGRLKAGAYASSSPARRVLRSVAGPGIAFALGLGLSAAFFLPALVEQGYINRTQWFGQYYDPTQHFVYFHQLFNPAWGFGISQPGPDDIAQGSMSFQLGAAAVVLALAGFFAGVGMRSLRERLGPDRRREIWFWAGWAIVSVALTMAISAPLWRYVPLVSFAQFPWRYLMLAIIPLSILPGVLIAAPASRPRGSWEGLRWPGALLAALLLVSSYPYLKVEMREPTAEQGPVSYAALMRFQRTSDEMTGVTAWVDPLLRPHWSPMADEWILGRQVTTRVDYGQVPQNETLAVNSEDMGSAHEQIYFYAKDPGQVITFNRFWYPGWRAYLLDGKSGRPVRELPVEREDGPLARIVVPIPAGDGYILLRFEDTPLRAAAKWITYGTLIAVALAAAAWYARPLWRPAGRSGASSTS